MRSATFVNSVFGGTNLFTRRGDFQLNQSGFLVNGAGFYLMGLPINPATGNPAGSIPTTLQFNNNLIPAVATTQIDYNANLPSQPVFTWEALSPLIIESSRISAPSSSK